MEQRRTLVDQLRAGYVPDTAEVDNARNSFAEARTYRDQLNSRISFLKEQISSLTNELSSVTGKRDAEEDLISIRLSLLSPVRRLPDDLLLEIFDQACPSNDITAGQTRCPSLVISHVCHSWRDLALSFPALWCRIRIQLDLKTSESESSEASFAEKTSTEPGLMEMYLNISRDFPLDIHIWGVEEQLWELDDLKESHKRSLFVLVHNTWQWRSLTCFIEDLPAFPELCSNFPLLTDVIVKKFSYHQDEDVRPLPSWLTQANNIEHVTTFDIEYPFIPYNWSSLKLLVVDGDGGDWTIELIRDFLSQIAASCTKLKELRWFLNFQFFDDFYLGSFTLDSLKCPRVGWDVRLDWIKAPNLQHLDVSESNYGEEGTVSVVVDRFLQASGVDLSTFTMAYDCLDYDRSATSFERMGNLVHLTCSYVTPLEIKRLIGCLAINPSTRPAGEIYFPQLRTFTVYWRLTLNILHNEWSSYNETEGMVIDELVVDFLESRRARRPLCFERFAVITAKNDRLPNKTERERINCQSYLIKDRLRRLRDGGLTLCFNNDWAPVDDLECL